MPLLRKKTPRSSNARVTTKFGFLKKITIVFLFFSLAIPPTLYFWQPADKIVCFTNLYTTCDSEIIRRLQPWYKQPWIKLPHSISSQESNLSDLNVVEIQIKKILPRKAEIRISLAQPLFTAIVEGQNSIFLSNGQVISTPDSSSSVKIIFQDVNTLQNLAVDKAKNLEYLLSKINDRTWQVQKMTFFSPQEVKIAFDNNPSIIVKVDTTASIDEQLDTLQAFLRSSTMEIEHEMLDLRFDGLAVVKD